MAERTKGKVVVITGGAQGIGFGCAELLVKEGAKVVIGDINAEKGRAAVETLRSNEGEAVFCQTNVLYEKECENLISTAVKQFGRLDGLLNNVGYYARATIEETDAELWDRYLNINLRSAFFCSKHAVKHMKNNGGGSIINIGSVHGLQSAANLVAYGVAKGGLLTLTKSFAGAYGRDHIRSNYIIPGWVITDTEVATHAKEGLPEAELRARGANLLFGRHQTPQDTAQVVLFLISDESSQITGMTFHIDAGMTTLVLKN